MVQILTMRTLDKMFIISITLVAVYWVVSLAVPDIGSPMIALYEWMVESAVVMGYAGTAIISFLGSASVIIEIPFVIVPFVLGGLRSSPTGPFLFNPWLIGLLSGVGATLGDMVSYVLGHTGARLLKEGEAKKFREFIDAHPTATPLVIWFLAVTPLPLDPAVVSLGAAKYPWWKVLIPSLVGEIIFLMGVAWAGRFSLDWVLALLGVGGPATILSRTSEVLGIVLLVLSVYLVVRLDWSKLILRKAHESKQV